MFDGPSLKHHENENKGGNLKSRAEFRTLKFIWREKNALKCSSRLPTIGMNTLIYQQLN